MDFAIEITGIEADMTWDKATDITNNVYLSIMVRKGSWFFNPDFGSRLHELTRSKNTDRTARLAEKYAEEALQWLLDLGRATDVSATATRETERIALLVSVTQADGRQISYETFVEVV